jgi:hypothetical protein
MPNNPRAAQPSLLDWTPPQPVARFPEDKVRAATIASAICRGISVAMKECELSRDEISERMADFLGEPVSKNMLDAYSSEAREDHIINVVRFIALIHATEDRRLLELVADRFGWSVIEKRYLPLIELAHIHEAEDKLRRQRKSLTRRAQREGSF